MADSVKIKITGDDSGYKNVLNKLGATTKSALSGVATAATATATAITAVTAAVVRVTNSFAEAGDTINDTAPKLNLSRKAYQEWDYILSQNGSSIDAMNLGMKTLQNTMVEAAAGSKTAVAALKAVGLTADEVSKMSPEQAFEATVKAFQELPAGAAKTAAAVDMFGRQGMDLLPLLNSTTTSIDELKNKAQELGLIMSDDMVDSAGQYADMLDTTKRAAAAAGYQITAEFIPALTGVLEGFTQLVSGKAGGMEAFSGAVDVLIGDVASKFPGMLEAGTKLILSLVDGMVKNLPSAFKKLSAALPGVLKSILASAPQMVAALFEIASSLASDLIAMLPELVPMILEGAAKMLLEIGLGIGKLLNSMFDGIWKSILELSQVDVTVGKVKVDTSAIDDAIKKSEKTTYDLSVLTDAKIKLSTSSTDLNNQIVTWLTDGKAETEKQKDEYKTKANEVLAPVYAAIQEAFDEKKAALDEQLSGGIIDKATYDARLEELKTTTGATKTSLDAEAQAYISYVLTLAAQGTKPTEEQIAKLEEMRLKIVGIGDSILEAQNIALQAGKASFTATAAGRGTTEDVVKGVAYLKMDTEVKMEGVETAHEQAMADLQTEWDKAKTPELKTEIEAKMELENTSFEAGKEKVEADYTARLSEMIEGFKKKFPEQMDKLAVVDSKATFIGNATAVLQRAFTAKPEDKKAAEKAMNDYVENLFPGSNPLQSPLVSSVKLQLYIDELKKQMAAAVLGADMSEVFTNFSAALDTGATENLDASKVGATLGDLITAYDFAPDGKTLMESLLKGEIQGLDDGQGDLNQAIIDSALEGNQAFKDEQGINSPSTVWAGYGENMIQGLVDGIGEKQQDVADKAKEAAKKADVKSDMKKSGENSGQGWLDGFRDKAVDMVIAAYNAGKAVKKAFDRGQNAASPSKAFRESGQWSGQGWEIGYKESMGKALKTARSIGRDMVGAVNLPARIQIPQVGAIGTAGTLDVMSALRGLFDGSNFNFNDRQDMQTFAYEFMGILNNQIRAVGGTP